MGDPLFGRPAPGVKARLKAARAPHPSSAGNWRSGSRPVCSIRADEVINWGRFPSRLAIAFWRALMCLESLSAPGPAQRPQRESVTRLRGSSGIRQSGDAARCQTCATLRRGTSTRSVWSNTAQPVVALVDLQIATDQPQYATEMIAL